jgi:hypothetical protein
VAEALLATRTEVTAARLEMSALRDAARHLRAMAGTLETKAHTAGVTAERDALRSQLAELQRRLDGVTAELATRTADLATRTRELAARSRELTARTGELTARIGERDAAREESRLSRSELTARIRALEAFLPTSSAYQELLRGDGSRYLTNAAGTLSSLGFGAGATLAGITYGIGTVAGAALTSKSEYAGYPKEPGCRLLYTAGNTFCTSVPAANEWLQVDLGAERNVAGVLTQGLHATSDSSATGNNSWYTIKCQASATGADGSWTDVDGGRTWTRAGLRDCDVLPSVFTAAVRCRYLRVVSVVGGWFCRWEVVLAP